MVTENERQIRNDQYTTTGVQNYSRAKIISNILGGSYVPPVETKYITNTVQLYSLRSIINYSYSNSTQG